MFFSDPQSIKDFLVEAIGEEHMGEYTFEDESPHLYIRAEFFCIKATYRHTRYCINGEIKKSMAISRLIISCFDVPKHEINFLSGHTFSSAALDFYQSSLNAHIMNKYKKKFKERINGWFFEAIDQVLKSTFDP